MKVKELKALVDEYLQNEYTTGEEDVVFLISTYSHSDDYYSILANFSINDYGFAKDCIQLQFIKE